MSTATLTGSSAARPKLTSGLKAEGQTVVFMDDAGRIDWYAPDDHEVPGPTDRAGGTES